MKPSIYRRIRRRSATEAAAPKKDSQQEQSFFGNAMSESFFQPAPVIQRQCDNCEKEEKVQRAADKKEEEKLQRSPDKKEEEKVHRSADKKEEEKLQKKESNSNAMPASNVSSYVNSLNSKGSPMPQQSKQFFSARMGYDFGDVKIHTDKEAAESAKAVNARAYTVGNNIVFNEGQYNNESTEGKKLMAHELVHVLQQASNSANMLQRITCDGTAAAPPRVAQATNNPIDARAQAIIDIASGTQSASIKSVSVVTQIICKYYPGDAALVNSVIYNASLSGLETTRQGSGASATGIIGVGDYYLQGTNVANFARRVLQVGHELDHIRQYRSGLTGQTNQDLREFLAHAENALADEFEGTGKMTYSTRFAIVNTAIGYYYCLSSALQAQHQNRLTQLLSRRQGLVNSGRLSNPAAISTNCTRP